MIRVVTKRAHTHDLQFSPFFPNKLAAASGQFYGLAGKKSSVGKGCGLANSSVGEFASTSHGVTRMGCHLSPSLPSSKETWVPVSCLVNK